MRIIEAISDTNIGGAGILLVNRLKHTDREKYKTTVLIPKDSRLCQRLADIKVDFVEIDGCRDSSFDLSALPQYIREIKKIHPQIINSHGCMTSRVAAYLCRVPVRICTRHCVFPISPRGGSRRRVTGAVNSALSHRFVAVAHAAAQNLIDLGVNGKKITVIINGAEALQTLDDNQKREIRRRLDISDTTHVLCMNARLVECKGHKYLLLALKKLLSEGFDVTALLLGDGSHRGELERQCRDLGIGNSVIFTGFVPDVSPYMNIAHININCSVGTETSSLALSEGMSIGLPAVVSDFGGNPYMVRHGVNGFVYPQGDHVALSDSIKRLIEDRELYRQMSENSRRRFAEELNAAAMADKTTALYDLLYGRTR